MSLVDASVWIEFFGGRATPEAGELERLLDDGEVIYTCGVILTEVLQGIRDDADYRAIRTRFDNLIFLPMRRRTSGGGRYVPFASPPGRTVRKPIDCMIAAVAIENDLPLLHRDRDFDPIEKHCGLKVVKPRPSGP